MFAAVRQGGGAGPKANRLPALLLILFQVTLGCVFFLWFAPAHAGALFRCVGSQGEVVFSGNAAGYHDCKQVTSFATAAPHAARATKEVTSLAWVTGWADTTAQPIAPIVVSLDRVQGGVETTAQEAPASPLLTGKPGQWTYSESRDALSAAQASAGAQDSPDNRVLTGAVYRVVHKDGSVEYTNIQPSGALARNVTRLFSYIATCMACNLHSPINWGTVHLDLTDYADVIHNASLESGVDEALIRAIIHAESAFNPRAMSLKGAQGLMQLMPSTANDMGVLDAFDPAQNIHGGARYLGLLLKNFNGDVRLTAAAYNAGPGAVQHYNGVPPFAETQVYVQRVGELLQRYNKALRTGPASASL
ncbi:lytic transglycosylase domain-containing protein [Dyella caseinilytica]|uniref:Lytic transglycosylase domain-containing protein n=1 Tax=Dyella caseinilytica TaxID=1849581 RepID=A0ABX7GVC8_9GAMM|nr:lytic transglycosylase domain-containing protein [Dyella caseinilytica]QRN54416.1 lytic transglycosylase domain-containing protein [Dyella caseinilytica]GFZ94073.1 murein transglycosylase [Dyella caseinilytica]